MGLFKSKKRQFENCLSMRVHLFTKIQFLNYGTVPVNVLSFQVIEQGTPFTDQSDQCALRAEILFVYLEVFCEVINAKSKKSDLAFS